MTATRPGAAGALVLVATPIGNLDDLSPRAVQALAQADVIACEDTRHTRKLLTHAGIAPKRVMAVHDHNEASQVAPVLALLAQGRSVAVVSDAGTPGISDPGWRLAAAAAAAHIPVSVVPGPSALVGALVVSGLATGRFCFEGFLPRGQRERAARLEVVAADSRTTVLYEAPHRLVATLAALVAACGPDRRMAVVRELTKRHEEVWRGTLGAALARAQEAPPRGEHTLVVAGAPPLAPPEEADLEGAVAARLGQGRSTRQLADEVAAELGVGRRRAYAVALQARAAEAAGAGTDQGEADSRFEATRAPR